MIANSYYKKLKKKAPGIKMIWDGFYSGEEMNEVIEKAISGITSERHDGMIRYGQQETLERQCKKKMEVCDTVGRESSWQGKS